jgi:hypothetical protein
LEAYGQREIVEIIDMSGFVTDPRTRAATWRSGELLTPFERVYVPADRSAAANVDISANP